MELTPGKHARLMGAHTLKLRCWSDVPAALSSLKKAGIRLAFLSNNSYDAGGPEYGTPNCAVPFDVLSTDRVRVYKPDPLSDGP